MIAIMKENDWPDDRVNMHIAFWSALQNHRWHHNFNVHKQRALLLYQAQQCKHWHLAAGSSNSWSRARINQDLLNEAHETIFNQFRTQQIAQLQVCFPLCQEPQNIAHNNFCLFPHPLLSSHHHGFLFGITPKLPFTLPWTS